MQSRTVHISTIAVAVFTAGLCSNAAYTATTPPGQPDNNRNDGFRSPDLNLLGAGFVSHSNQGEGPVDRGVKERQDGGFSIYIEDDDSFIWVPSETPPIAPPSESTGPMDPDKLFGPIRLSLPELGVTHDPAAADMLIVLNNLNPGQVLIPSSFGLFDQNLDGFGDVNLIPITGFQGVPAPGVLSLLGLAALMGRRRRRIET